MVLKVNHHLPKDVQVMEQCTGLGEGSRCAVDSGLILAAQGRKTIDCDSLLVTESIDIFSQGQSWIPAHVDESLRLPQTSMLESVFKKRSFFIISVISSSFSDCVTVRH